MAGKKGKKSKKPIGVLIVILIILIALGAGAFWCFGGTRSTNLDTDVIVTIPEGSYAKQVADILDDNGLVFNAFSFLLYIKSENAGNDLKPGVYTFKAGKVTYRNLLDELLKGGMDGTTTKITIPEGYSMVEIADLLAENGIGTAEDFLMCASQFDLTNYPYITPGEGYAQLEGFLFPDTYIMKYDWDSNHIITVLLNEFEKKWTPERQQRAEALGLTAEQVITVASLIEKEAMLDSERPMIASVIYNRINAGMKLQIDATVLYALGKHKSKVTYEDLKVDSPYNTYLHEGLPPGPIASPGEKSIEAALNPADTKYLFYQTTEAGDGSHYFCETYEEHLAFTKRK